MSSLRLLLGLIPSTLKIEQAEKALIDEFEKLQVFTKSDLLAKYTKLHDLVNSSSFVQKRKEIESLKYKNSEEYSREKEFLSLQKAKDILLYFKTISGSMLKRFRDLDGSQKIRDFEEIESFIKSNTFRQRRKMKPITFKDSDEYRKLLEYKSLRKDPEIKAFLKAPSNLTKSQAILKFEELGIFIKSPGFLAKKNMKPITFKDTEEYKKLLEYNRLKNSLEIKEYYRFKSSKEYANFLNIDGSARLARYNELKEYVATPAFKERKNYLLDTKRFEKTEEYKDAQEYEKLKKNEDIIWYFKVKDSDKFDVLKKKELTFIDDFNSDTLDTNKWLTNFYWGDKLLKDHYSVENDLHAYTEKDNFEIRNSLLKIHTKPQRITGKVWSASSGFKTREFSYTSGLINSGKSFRQMYGVFSAKIKLGNPVARNNFWMLADKITPHIDICRTSNNKVWTDFVADPGRFSKSSIGPRYANDFYIYTLEWTQDKLVWKINGQEIFRQTSDVPQVPMYILLAGGLDKPISGMTTMEVDWVKVFQFR
ncbi:MAG: glycoside hydrolase family 16 protein [Bacteroidia bacterium]|nr:MAG: glycoside hydrolase family 16 protein [Bacteroidia bacterium]